MAGDDVQIDIGLDPSSYLAGVDQLTSANSSLQRSFTPVLVQSALVQRAFEAITPKRAALAGWGAMSAAAADAQQSMSGLAATAAVTGINTTRLGDGMRQLARDMPLGNAGARQLVTQFTQMGVASAGSEKRILDLSKTVGLLSGATGEAPAVLAQGMTDLARATGNTNLDPKRFASMADSLTTVSKETGASAGNILAFSKQIAPMAQAAGIGTTGILGISSAFSQMGEDGTSAATAVNKMLSDLNTAVRQGSPVLQNYAKILGTTTDQFTQMFQANPAETISSLTKAIAGAGNAGPRELASIGIDGIRGQRAFQALVNNGGLDKAIAQAQAGYGNGSTAKAGQAAFDTLNSATTELASNAQQLAEALGAPLLGPLTAFTKALQFPIKGMTGMANNSVVQKGLEIGSYGLVAAMIGRMGLRSLVGAALGRQALTSGPVRSLFAGRAAARGDVNTFSSRFGAQAAENARTGIWPGMMGPTSEKVYTASKRFYEQIEAAQMRRLGVVQYMMRQQERQQAQLSRQGQSFPRRAASAAWRYGTAGVRFAADSYRIQMENSYSGINDRRDSWTNAVPREMRQAHEDARQGGRFAGGWFSKRAWGEYIGTFREGMRDPLLDTARAGNPAWKDAYNRFATGHMAGEDPFKSFRASFRAFNDSLTDSTKSATRFGATMRSLAGAGLETGRAGGSMLGLGAKGIRGLAGAGWRGLQSVTNGLGGPVAIGAAALGYFYNDASNRAQEHQDAMSSFDNSDIRGTINAYRESIGKATVPVVTFASLSTQLNKTIASGIKTFDDAFKITDEDKAAAAGTRGQVVHHYAGSTQDMANQIAASSVAGLTPQDVQAAKIDMFRQNYSDSQVQAVLAAIPKSSLVQPGADTRPRPTKADPSKLKSLVDTEAAIPDTADWYDKVLEPGWGSIGEMSKLMGEPDWMPSKKLSTAPGGGRWSESSLSRKARDQLDVGIQNIGQTKSANQAAHAGSSYTAQEELKGYNAMLKEAFDKNDAAAFAYIASRATKSATGKELAINPADFAKNGFDLGKTAAAMDPKGYGNSFKELTAAGYRADGTGGIKPAQGEDPNEKLLKPISKLFSTFYDSNANTDVAKKVADSLNKSDDPGKFLTAVKAMTSAALDSKSSLGDLAVQAAKTANALPDGSPDQQLTQAVQQRLETGMGLQTMETGSGATATGNLAYYQGLATVTPSNQAGSANQQKGEQGYVSEATGDYQKMQQRLQAQFQYEVQVKRATDSFNLQKQYAIDDYNTNVFRTERNYNTQRARALEDFERGQAHTIEDFNINKAHEIRDFNISMGRAEEDYLKTRLRAIRDFNIAMQRMVEDAAKSLYDPYNRIQAQAVWDAQNLLANLAEQNQAMEKQKTQLDQLRKAGLSAQAIQQLSLGDTKNAEQVDQLTSDVTTDPSLIAQFNKTAAERGNAAKALVTDPSNDQYTRAQQDQAKSLSDMAKDNATNQARAVADLKKSLGDQAAALALTLKRGNEEFKISADRAVFDLNQALGDMAFEQNKMMVRQKAAFDVQMKNMADDLVNAGKVIGGDFTAVADAYYKTIHGQAGAYQKLIIDDTGNFAKAMQAAAPGIDKALSVYGVHLPLSDFSAGTSSPAPSSPGKASAAHSGANQKMYGMGGPSDSTQSGGAGGGYANPLHGSYPETSPFGYRTDPFTGAHTFHPGEDFGAPTGTSIYAALAGIVKWAGNRNDGYGNYVIIDHGSGHESVYGHMSSVGVKAGQHVTPANLIGRVGSTGRSTAPHLHFETRVDGKAVPPEIAGSWSDNATGAAGLPTAEQLYRAAGMDMKRGGMFGKLRNNVMSAINQALALVAGPASSGLDSLAGSLAGDTGAHSGAAKANQAIARSLLGRYGFSDAEMTSLIKLWNGESGWNQFADNPSSGAYGIPQSLPGEKMATIGADWRTNPATQIEWGLGYIKDRYGTPSHALEEWNARSPHWYAAGGILSGAQVIGVGEKGPEAVIPLNDAGVAVLARAFATYLSSDDAKEINGGNCSHMSVVHNEKITYDNRNDFADAKITVVSQDPDAMARALSKRAVAQRLTQTKGVRWGH